jgi:hypothetical protein
VLLLCIVQLLEVAWYPRWDRTCSILYSKDHDTCYVWPIKDLGLRSGGYNIINKSVYTLNQVACFMQNFFYKLFPPKWRNLTMKTLSYKLRRLSICSFDQISSLLFPPFQSCFIYHVLLFVDDVVTSWPQTKISDWSDIKCIVILSVQNRTCSIPKCVSCNF